MQSRPIRPFALATYPPLLLATTIACGDPTVPGDEYDWVDVGQEEEAMIKAVLANRSFRQFDPSRDGDPRKAIVIDFHGGLAMWAEFAEDGRATDEWEVSEDSYWIQRAAGRYDIYRLNFSRPRVRRTLPEECEDCIDVSGLAILVRDYGNAARINFILVDADGNLPLPFPVFHSWTRFEEDETVQ